MESEDIDRRGEFIVNKYVVKKTEIAFWILITGIWSALYWTQCVIKDTGDFFCHNAFAKLVVEGKLILVYPIYHILVGVLAKITGLLETEASVFILVFAQILSIIVMAEIIKQLSDVWKNNMEILAVSFMLNIVQPIFFNNYKPGASSGNGLFSPTLTMVKPFALLSILLFYKMYRDKDYGIKKQILFFTALLSTCLIKPMFTMAFIPAAGILLLIETINNVRADKADLVRNFAGFIIRIMPMIIIGIVLIAQFIFTSIYDVPVDALPAGVTLSSDKNSHIRIGYMRSWSLAVDNVYISLLLTYLFPLVVLAVIIFYGYRNNIRVSDSAKTKLKSFRDITISYGIVSFFYMAFLYQEGKEIDMNFRNAWVVTFNLIYIFAFVYLAEIKKSVGKRSALINLSYIVWGIHLLFGVALITKYIIG